MASSLSDKTAENIFLSLLQQQGLAATTLDLQSLNGIVTTPKNKIFGFGTAPYYVQIKCRGSSTKTFKTQAHPPKTFERIRVTAKRLKIPITSVYFVVGFYHNSDVRTIKFFGIPLDELSPFKWRGQYRFSMKRCSQLQSAIYGMFAL